MKIQKLNQPAQIAEPYRAIVLAFLKDYVHQENERLRVHFGATLESSEIAKTDDEHLSLPIADAIADIVQVAAGNTKKFNRLTISEKIAGLVGHLFRIPGDLSSRIPEEFWRTDFGAMIMAAYIWCQGDTLITITEAAEISDKSIKSISQFIARGKLRSYPDMSEPNPRKRTRVLKSEALALR